MWFVSLIALAFLVCTFAQLTVSTPPALVQCQPVRVSWEGGSAPYILAIIPGGQPAAPALVTVASDLPSSPYTWIVNVRAGTSVNIKVTDGSGTIQYSSPITIQNSNNADCIGGGNNNGAGEGGASEAPAPSTSDAPVVPSSSSELEQEPSTSFASELPSTSPTPSSSSSSSTITQPATSTQTQARPTTSIKPLSTPVNPASGSVIRSTSGFAAPQVTAISGVLAGGLGLVGGLALLI